MTGEARRNDSRGVPTRGDLPSRGARVHLVGIGGAGMRGLAVLLADDGYRVTGCDRSAVGDAPDLTGRGVVLQGDHDPDHVGGQDLVVHTSAVGREHPELRRAREAEVPVMKRARATGALVNGRRLAAVSGTHGKTTTTAMTAAALVAAGVDPAALVGGRVPEWNGYARPGRGEVAVVEADEFDRSFLQLDPSLLLVTSVEEEHLDSYGSAEALEEAFRRLAGRASGRDGVLYCADDRGAARAVGDVEGAKSYGFAAEADYTAEEPDASGRDGVRLRWPGGTVSTALGVAGRHNAQNAAGALAAALMLGAEAARLEDALAGHRGVDRRLQVLADGPELAVVDDYAHHPTEVRASLAALRRRYPDRRVAVVFQPHLYSRTRDFAREFAAALAEADAAAVLPIYPSREEPIPGVTSELITGADEGVGLRPADPEEVSDPEWLRELAGSPSVVVFMGAGDVTDMAREAARGSRKGARP